MQNNELTHTTVCAPVSSRTSALFEILAVAGAVYAASLVKVQLGPVPFTLQTFPVLLAGLLVGRRSATAGVLLYLGLSAAGAPLLANSFGATVGYLVAFAVTPLIVTAFRNQLIGITAATLAIYALGATWLVLYLNMSPAAALMVGVVPFIPGDILKGLAAWRIAKAANAS